MHSSDRHALSMTKSLLVGGKLIYKPRVCFGKWQKDNTVHNGLKHTKLLVWLFNTIHVQKGGHYNIIFTDTFVFLLPTTLLSGQCTSSHLISPLLTLICGLIQTLADISSEPTIFFLKCKLGWTSYCYTFC